MDWDFTAYNEDCVIVGMKGSGKTYLANEILRGLSNVNVIVYDFNWQFSESRAVVIHNIDELFKASKVSSILTELSEFSCSYSNLPEKGPVGLSGQ